MTIESVADRLLHEIPESDRAEARNMLTTSVLPIYLEGLAEHPQPERLAEAAYDRIAGQLKKARPAGRLAVLRDIVRRTQFDALGRDSLVLAIARYLSDHSEAAEKAGHWVDSPVEAWKARPVSELAAEAMRLLAELELLKSRTEAEAPEFWPRVQQAYLIAKMTLQSARSGAFGSSSGPLWDFLRQVGARTQRLDLH